MASKSQKDGSQQELGAKEPFGPTASMGPATDPSSVSVAGSGSTNALAPTNGNGDKPKVIDKRLAAGNTGQLSRFFEQNRSMIEEFARGFMRYEDITRMAVMAMSRQPIIGRCTLGSILRCLMDASALRVRPGGLNGRGYLVPRKNNKTNPPVWEAHFDPGWRGLVDVARRSGQIKSIGAQVVREGDEFSYGYHPLPKLDWKPMRGGDDNRPIVAAFAVAELADGAVQIEVIDLTDAKKIMAVSEAAKANSGPWFDWPEEMWRKSVVKRLCKYLPVPDDYAGLLDKAMAMSDGADTGERFLGDPNALEVDGEELGQADAIRGQLESGEGTVSAEDQLAALEAEAAGATA